MNILDVSKTIFELSKEDDTFIDHLYACGFMDIIKPGMLQTVGRFMTLEKGCQLKKIDFNKVIIYFKQKGYMIKENSNE